MPSLYWKVSQTIYRPNLGWLNHSFMETRSFLFDHKKISYSITGTGEPLFLVHGYRADSRCWHWLIKHLKNNFTLVMPDLPGHGNSQLIWKNHSMSQLSEVLHRLCLELNYTSVSMVGHSMGGYVALAFARNFPGFVKNTFLVNAHPFVDSPEKKQIRLKEIKLIHEGKREILVKSSAKNSFSNYFIDSHIADIMAITHQMLEQSAMCDLADLNGMLSRTDCFETAKKFNDRICFIFGSEDSLMPKTIVQRLQNEFRSFVLDACGHMIIIEAPENLAQLILADHNNVTTA